MFKITFNVVFMDLALFILLLLLMIKHSVPELGKQKRRLSNAGPLMCNCATKMEPQLACLQNLFSGSMVRPCIGSVAKAHCRAVTALH